MLAVRFARPGALCHGQSTMGWTCAGHAVSTRSLPESYEYSELNSRAFTRYQSIRIDPVHYCELEFELCEKRKRKSHRFDRNGEQADVPALRLQLLSRTVRENQYLASQVQYLKMPYMTRESCVSDLARTVHVLPNLRYIDLPEGFFSDSPSSATLKHELQIRCPDIRKMRYNAGAERSFAMLPQTRQWQNLEALELSHLSVEPSMLVYAFSSFPVLQELKLVDIPLLEDSIFQPNLQGASFPPVAKLSLRDTPNVTAPGLLTYLSSPLNRENLSSLHLTNTGILIDSLHKILATAPYLTTLNINATVSRPVPRHSTPLLTSRSLRTLHFLISSASSKGIAQTLPPSESYYEYLASSLLSGSLPALESLYALSTTLPTLLLPPPSAPFAGETHSLAPPTAPFAQHSPSKFPSRGLPRALHLYTKPILELEWQYTYLSPPTAHNRRGSRSATRPVSLYGNGIGVGPGGGVGAPVPTGPKLGEQWGGSARDSVLVGNGFGGYLAVPREDEAGMKSLRRKDREIGTWMG